MQSNDFDARRVARRLFEARNGAPIVHGFDIAPPDPAGAYAVQDETLALAGPAGGWKVGAKTPQAEPSCAPLPRAGLLESDCTLAGPTWKMRGIEVEVALRLARDIRADESREDILGAIDAVLPAVEVVESRLADWRESDPLAQLADLGLHGALVLGEPLGMDPRAVDLRQVEAYLAFDGQPVASCCGANPAADLWRLIAWLARHAAERGRPLRAGDVITTGSCTGLLFAHEGAHVQAQLKGIGEVELRF
ncbi:MAG TPA: fumarylacetoacetate hydrolase family protein [Ramlibacter sp.]|uniref:2-keto-4-pentenoate hydratase n=1 Tax=Ramlibacter sp. TaxID=1917967 RepID=UPI002D09BA09|nr:fumarylacetoacetate hydrolase family protein [Ramlibacter sp.]HVZ46242.1 fumarylacetoacetate hydrolase family protein [Ramlibacter sp.]